MQDQEPKYFTTINGISAASGLYYYQEKLFLISDNSGFLYEFDINSNKLSKHKLLDNASENMPKKLKPDFESISFKNEKLFVFGSGSSKNRNFRHTFDLHSAQTKSKDIKKWYKKCKNIANFGEDDLNIEGSFFVNNKWYLWQRGNGENGRNGVFVYDKKSKNIDYQTIELPKINGFQTTFTDCILVEGKIFFLAAAENSSSTVDDGLIYGSMIGCLDLDSFALISLIKISDTQKFEGLTLFENTDLRYSFLICEDSDTLTQESKIYKFTIEKD